MDFDEANKVAKRLGGKSKVELFKVRRVAGGSYDWRRIDRDGCNVGEGPTWLVAVDAFRARVTREKEQAAELARIRAEAVKLGRVSRAAVLREVEAKYPEFTRLEYATKPNRDGDLWLRVEFPGKRAHTATGKDWATILVRVREQDFAALANEFMTLTFGRPAPKAAPEQGRAECPF